MLSNSTNITLDTEQEWNATDIILIPTVGLVVATGCGVALNTALRNLHEIIKGILNVLILHNAVSAIVLQIVESGWDEDFITCSLAHVLRKGQGVVAVETLALLSFVRYHLTKKAEKHQSADLQLIKILTVMIYLGYYGIELLFIVSGNVAVPIVECAKLKGKGSLLVLVVTNLKALIILSIGIAFDVKMILYLKKRNQLQLTSGPAKDQFIPWKTGDVDESHGNIVPIGATVVSLIAAVVGPSVMTLIVTDKNANPYLFKVAPSLAAYVMLPTMLLLTLRVALKKTQGPQIPTELQFYENNNTEDEEEVNNPFEEPALVNQDPTVNPNGQLNINGQPIQIPLSLQVQNGNQQSLMTPPFQIQVQFKIVGAEKQEDLRIAEIPKSRVIFVKPCDKGVDADGATSLQFEPGQMENQDELEEQGPRRRRTLEVIQEEETMTRNVIVHQPSSPSLKSRKSNAERKVQKRRYQQLSPSNKPVERDGTTKPWINQHDKLFTLNEIQETEIEVVEEDILTQDMVQEHIEVNYELEPESASNQTEESKILNENIKKNDDDDKETEMDYDVEADFIASLGQIQFDEDVHEELEYPHSSSNAIPETHDQMEKKHFTEAVERDGTTKPWRNQHDKLFTLNEIQETEIEVVEEEILTQDMVQEHVEVNDQLEPESASNQFGDTETLNEDMKKNDEETEMDYDVEADFIASLGRIQFDEDVPEVLENSCPASDDIPEIQEVMEKKHFTEEGNVFESYKENSLEIDSNKIDKYPKVEEVGFDSEEDFIASLGQIQIKDGLYETDSQLDDDFWLENGGKKSKIDKEPDVIPCPKSVE